MNLFAKFLSRLAFGNTVHGTGKPVQVPADYLPKHPRNRYKGLDIEEYRGRYYPRSFEQYLRKNTDGSISTSSSRFYGMSFENEVKARKFVDEYIDWLIAEQSKIIKL